MYDWILSGGTVVDGSGRPAYRADVAIRGSEIASIGDLSGESARERIDASGKIVAPGFIDIHSHSDWTILANPAASSSIHQGVTTELMGNCGFSFAPTDDPQKIVPLVPTYMRDLIEVDWCSFDEYLQRIEEQNPAINVCHLVGHHALRLSAIGFDARPPTEKEQREMEAALARALDEGGVGVSFGLEYTPGVNATLPEMLGLAKVAASKHAMVTIHMRNQDDGYLDAVNEALDLARHTGVRLQISHIPPHLGNPPSDWPDALALILHEIENGLDVSFDAHPYLWGGTLLTRALPPWAFEGGVDAVLARLQDPETRAAIKAYPEKTLRSFETGEWDKFIITYTKHSRQFVGKTVREIAEELQVEDPYDVVFDILVREGKDLFSALWVTELIEPDIQHDILRHPTTIIESDGMTLSTEGPLGQIGWHPRCFGWTARVLSEHVREQRIISMEEAIHKMTLKPAQRIGLARRGAVMEGYFADLVVFDPEQIQDNASYRDPNHYPDGIEWVLVNGEVALAHGHQTVNRAGRVLRFSPEKGVVS